MWLLVPAIVSQAIGTDSSARGLVAVPSGKAEALETISNVQHARAVKLSES
jgi:hypothetical protein